MTLFEMIQDWVTLAPDECQRSGQAPYYYLSYPYNGPDKEIKTWQAGAYIFEDSPTVPDDEHVVIEAVLHNAMKRGFDIAIKYDASSSTHKCAFRVNGEWIHHASEYFATALLGAYLEAIQA